MTIRRPGSRGRRGVAVLAAAGLASVLGMGVAEGSAGSGAISPWALEAENPNPSQTAVPLAQAVADAQHFNLLIAHPVDFSAADVAAMRKANPSLKILAYINATFSQPGQTFPDGDYAHTAAGKRITQPGTGNFMMNPNVADWVNWRIYQCQQFLAQTGYDGCYLDVLGLAPLLKGYVNGVAVDPVTNKPWTQAQWLAATAALAKSVHDAVHPKLVMGNGLSSGPLFYQAGAPTSQLVAGMDGGIAEAWLRLANAPENAFPTLTAWKQCVSMIGAVEQQGKPLLTLTKMWAKATAAQVTQWQTFALATFLLGTQGRSMFFFSGSPSGSRTTTYSLYSTKIGEPSGAYRAVSGGAYERLFSTGIALVNPGAATVHVTLPGSYVSSTGQRMTSVTMTAHTGALLTK